MHASMRPPAPARLVLVLVVPLQPEHRRSARVWTRPYVPGQLPDADSKSFIEGGSLSFDLCPSNSFVSDLDGKFAGKMTKGSLYNPRIEAKAYVTTRTGEQILRADFDASGPMIPVALRGLFPHWSDVAPTILAAVAFSADPAPVPDPKDPCTDKSGYVFAVKGHPEALVTYYAGDTTPTADAALKATGPLGIAEITGLKRVR